MSDIANYISELRKSCQCLYLEVDPAIANDITARAEAVIKLVDSCKIGPYTISPYPPMPKANQINVAWVQKDDGEGMSLDLDELWEDF